MEGYGAHLAWQGSHYHILLGCQGGLAHQGFDQAVNEGYWYHPRIAARGIVSFSRGTEYLSTSLNSSAVLRR
jgi:hypothetical protein